jgi:hypothetical protein
MMETIHHFLCKEDEKIQIMPILVVLLTKQRHILMVALLLVV